MTTSENVKAQAALIHVGNHIREHCEHSKHGTVPLPLLPRLECVSLQLGAWNDKESNFIIAPDSIWYTSHDDVSDTTVCCRIDFDATIAEQLRDAARRLAADGTDEVQYYPPGIGKANSPFVAEGD